MTSLKKHLNILSWNVRGLNDIVKRSKVFAHLNCLHADILFLQETHIKHSCAHRLRCRWIGQMYHSTFSSKARGVSILIRKNIPFNHLSTKQDINGRYLIVTGTILEKHVTFVNLYAPNFDDPHFFRSLFNIIPEVDSTHLIIGGDFNCILDPFMDRHSPSPPKPSNSATVLNNLIHSLNIFDIWRLHHPTDKDYSFFSNVHNSYTRIDYFLTDFKLTPKILSSKYHNILISDHSPVSIAVDFGMETSPYSWRFNPTLLNEDHFKETFATHIAEFLTLNDKGDVSDSTLWEALKAVIRGQVISFQAERKRQRGKRLSEIETELPVLEDQFKLTSSNLTLASIMKLKYEYNTLLSEQISSLLLKIKQKQFELSDKPNRLLARQLRGIQASRAIKSIKLKSGTLTNKPTEINNVFREFYQELYSSQSSVDSLDITNFLRSLGLPKISEDAKENLNSDITLEEVSTAIRSFPNGKAAGPDGFCIEFYKAFSNQIGPLMLRMFKNSIENKKLPETLYSANIALILKKDKDSTDPSSYRPISLLGNDLKIFTKILANRLSKCISSIIHEDQTGFIPGRFSFHNVRRLMNIVYKSKGKHDKIAILALDAYKAFDSVEWSYIISTIEEFGLGQNFSSWVEMLYLCPSASVLTNNNRSCPFPLHRGTRQGCPLSPLLFAIAMEPLAISIRNHPHIFPVTMGGIKHQISLYADDVLLFLSEPERSLPFLFDLIRKFGTLSGYTVNWQKSEFMPLYDTMDPVYANNLPFRTVSELKYLGITVPRHFKSLYETNYKVMIDNLKSDVETWRVLPLTMIGRVNAIKMVTLPRFLYLFQNVPIFLNQLFFKTLDSVIMPFIWGYKAHRISKAHICKSKDVGGLGLPCFQHYYWAANLRGLMYWLSAYPETLNSTIPAWLVIERDIQDSSLPALLFAENIPIITFKKCNPIVVNSLKIWYKIRKVFKLPQTCSLTPIAYNHAFPPSQIDKTFLSWRENGIVSIGDLYINNVFASFAQLRQKFGLPPSHFFRYLQVRSYVKSNIPNFETYKPPEHLYYCMTSELNMKGLVSNFVECLNDSRVPPTQHLKMSWEKDLGIDISEDSWTEALRGIKSCSISSNFQLIQYKAVHRLHYSRTKLHSIYPSVSPLCIKCKSNEGTLAHLFWFCPKICKFWSEVFCFYSKVLKKDFPHDPLVAILGWAPSLETFSFNQIQSIQYGMTIAKKAILLMWNKESGPKFEMWLAEFSRVLHMEKIRYEIAGKPNKFLQIWKSFMEFLEGDD